MGSEAAREDTAPVNESASPEGPDERVIGGRATPEEIYLIDRASLEVGLRRGPFIVEAAVKEARTVLAAKALVESSQAAA